MKKFLLSLGVLAGVLSANATVYTVYEPKLSDFTGGNDGYTSTLVVDGKSFTLTSEKAGSTTNLISPNDNDYSWRIYKNSKISITSADFDMKGVRFTIDGSKYAVAVTTGSGWTGELADLTYTFSNATGSKTFEITADGGQVRVSKIEVSDEEFSNDTPDVPGEEATVVKSIAEILEVKDGTAIKVDFPMTVAFKSNNNVFACDAERNFIQLYGSNEYNVNDVVPAGWEGTYKLYSGTTPEIEPATSFPAADGDNLFVPSVVDASAINVDMVNHVIAVADVVLSEASPADKSNFTGVSNGTTLNLRNNYTLESVAAGKYNMTLLVQVYQGAPSLYVINYDADVNGSGVAEIETAEGVAEFYTLQGVKVANPENGLFIMVSGGKATKVLVK
ncbi:MAG: hypothetical protein K2M39_10430 [Muribaculaceae bacterium]|nr:hypothetical protein [Muribaculaceae bacterium]